MEIWGFRAGGGLHIVGPVGWEWHHLSSHHRDREPFAPRKVLENLAAYPCMFCKNVNQKGVGSGFSQGCIKAAHWIYGSILFLWQASASAVPSDRHDKMPRIHFQ